MKIKTYTARDMRTALRLVRDEQGPDAVILSTRSSADGVAVEVAIETLEPVAVREIPDPVPTTRLAALESPPIPAPEPPRFADLLSRAAVVPVTPVAPVAALVALEAPRGPAEII